MQSLKRSAFFCIFLLLAACSSTPVKPLAEAGILWQARQLQLAQIQQWQLNGRTVITQGKEAWNANLYWQQNQDQYHIKLLGPFSLGGVELTGNEHSATLTLDDGQQISAANAESLLAETFSWQLPVNALHDWVRGLPYAKASYQTLELDDYGRITLLTQQGWQIKFLRYTTAEGLSLPSKIFITHPDISLRIVISQWDELS